MSVSRMLRYSSRHFRFWLVLTSVSLGVLTLIVLHHQRQRDDNLFYEEIDYELSPRIDKGRYNG